MSTRNRRTGDGRSMDNAGAVQLLAAAEALRCALVQLGGLEPPTSCSTGRIFAPTRLRHPRRCYENDSIIND
jgi:hypothetical protein